ncbi:FG-GAP repeat protein [Planctomycetes bacterium Poly30]|uniref:FG-GAP repeat protein n=1 Tax=Saltatorellus ferox TaxID=2528018 RepID=A0A518EML7_9BACT|nr:FG-GAP repeat protein [Planctomycetes bacterium Poly30]
MLHCSGFFAIPRAARVFLACSTLVAPLLATPQFGPARLINSTATAGARSAVALDVNLDGRKDFVATTDFFGALHVFRQDSMGGFDGGQRLRLDGSGTVSHLHAADLDGDGDLDLLVCDSETGRVAWLPVVGGARLFDSPQTITTDASAVEKATTGDVDGDGLRDIVVSAQDRQQVLWFKNLGAGQFGPEQILAPNQYLSTAIELVDVDLDGDLDLLTNSSLSGFHWYRNLGAGAFGPQIVLDFRMDTAREVHGGDIDGDGDVDYVGVGLDNGTGDVLVLFEGDGLGNLATSRTTLLAGAAVRSVALLDVNEDGVLDVVYQLTISTEVLELRALLHTGGGAFSDVLLAPMSSTTSKLERADFDGDGRVDLLGYADRVLVPIRNMAPSTFAEQPQVSTDGAYAFPVGLVDETGDGARDFIVSSSGLAVLPHLGEGRFGRPVQSVFQSEFLALPGAVGDLDGDGIADVLGRGPDQATGQGVSWSSGVGDGTFREPIAIPALPVTFSGPNLRLSDLDGDGDLDIHGVYEFLGRTFWVENMNQAQSWTYHDLASLGRPTELRAIDVNDDGQLDLVAYGAPSVATEGVAVYLNLGGGAFGPMAMQAAGPLHLRGENADFNGDGRLDVAYRVSGTSTEFFYLPNTGQGGFGPAVSMGVAPFTFLPFYAFDQDDDGDDDLVYVLRTGGLPPQDQLLWIENLGGSFAPYAVLQDPLGSDQGLAVDFIHGFFDVDGDGDRDPVWNERSSSPRFLVWRSNERELGDTYCSAVPNSTGVPATLSAAGTREVSANGLRLRATDLPIDIAGILIASRTQGFTAMPGGSLGNICLAGAVSRYARPGEVGFSGASGSFELALDLTDTPTATGAISVLAGETWNYQAWYRNVYQGATSNFTSALSVTFR